MSDRILCTALQDRVMSAADAAKIVKSGTTIAFSGFATGFPKVVPMEMCECGLHDLTLICGAALGPQLFGPVAESGMLSRYVGFQFDPFLRNGANTGTIKYIDCHLGQLGEKIRKGDFGRLDVSIIECTKINADGGIVPSVAVGMANTLFECSDKIILEVNSCVPEGIEGFHDICSASTKPINFCMERVGDTVYRCDPSKIVAIVETNEAEPDWDMRNANEVYEGIAKSVISCLDKEVADGKLEKEFTMQVGVGDVANTVLTCMGKAGYKNLKMYTEVFADPALDFLTEGLFSEVSTTCFDLCLKGITKVFNNLDFYRERIVMRPLDYTNGSPSIMNIGVVSMNTAVEIDMYGNVNSTHVSGTNMIYGVGGSNDYARNAKLTIFITPSTAKNDRISAIVPMVTHVDNTEHDTDIIVTEYGFADLRGKSPKERAEAIIENCAHPAYRPQLREYFEAACAATGNAQTPQILGRAYEMHERFQKTGSMLIAEA